MSQNKTPLQQVTLPLSRILTGRLNPETKQIVVEQEPDEAIVAADYFVIPDQQVTVLVDTNAGNNMTALVRAQINANMALSDLASQQQRSDE